MLYTGRNGYRVNKEEPELWIDVVELLSTYVRMNVGLVTSY